MTDFTIRDAVSGDAQAATAVIEAAYAPFADLEGLPDVASGLAEDIAKRIVLVAEDAGRIGGVAVLSVTGPEAHLVNLAVRPEAAGAGLGRRLIDEAERRGRAAGATRIGLGTHAAFTHALRLYARLGWVETGREGVKVTMAKRL